MVDELARELGHQAYPGRRERVTDRDGATVLIDSGIIVGHAEVIEKSQDLDRERLVQLNSPMSSMVSPVARRARSVDGIGPTPITSGSTPAKP